jgi:hypothetical protein
VNVNQDKLKRLAEAYGKLAADELSPATAHYHGSVSTAVDRARFQFRQVVGAGNYSRIPVAKLEQVAIIVGIPRRAGEALNTSFDRYLERMV